MNDYFLIYIKNNLFEISSFLKFDSYYNWGGEIED